MYILFNKLRWKGVDETNNLSFNSPKKRLYFVPKNVPQCGKLLRLAKSETPHYSLDMCLSTQCNTLQWKDFDESNNLAFDSL